MCQFLTWTTSSYIGSLVSGFVSCCHCAFSHVSLWQNVHAAENPNFPFTKYLNHWNCYYRIYKKSTEYGTIFCLIVFETKLTFSLERQTGLLGVNAWGLRSMFKCFCKLSEHVSNYSSVNSDSVISLKT